MRRGYGILIGVIAAFAAMTAIAVAQSSNLIPGYFDPKTTVFTPAPLPPAPEASTTSGREPVPPSTTHVLPPGGTVFIQVNATIQSPIPQDASLNATAQVSLASLGGLNSGGASYEFTLKRSNNTATGSATLTYLLPAPAAGLPFPLVVDMQVKLTLAVFSDSGPQPSIQFTQRLSVPQDGGNFTVTIPLTL